VCLDEAAKQLPGHKREVLPLWPGAPLRFDNPYERRGTCSLQHLLFAAPALCGTCSLFLVFEPLAAKRWVQVKERRTGLDYAHTLQWMCDTLYPHADTLIPLCWCKTT